MSYIALYRKWRPTTFSDVVEQEYVVKTLKKTVISQRIAHAYLFCGTRGTGKTTIAKIFARAINCLNPIDGDPCNECEICKGILNESLSDIIEMDAASNNGVDDIRSIIDAVYYSPAKAKYKVYIIDEVHMLSAGAFNALLKTLEEPPPHVVFLLATTDPHKLPATILSRCQRYEFKRISQQSIGERLQYIANQSEIEIDSAATSLLSRLADGALRDGISLLDQCISVGEKHIDVNLVRNVTGIPSSELLIKATQAITTSNFADIFSIVDSIISAGKDIQRFCIDLNSFFRDLLIIKVTPSYEGLIDPSNDASVMKELTDSLTKEQISFIIKELSILEGAFRQTNQARILAEASLVRISSMLPRINEALDERMAALEDKVNSLPKTQQIVYRDAPKVDLEPAKAKKKPDLPVETKFDKSKIKQIENFNAIINYISEHQCMSLYVYLSGSVGYYLSDITVGILLNPNVPNAKPLFTRPENLAALEDAVAAVLKKQYRVKILSNDDELSQALELSKKDSSVEDALESFCSKEGIDFSVDN